MIEKDKEITQKKKKEGEKSWLGSALIFIILAIGGGSVYFFSHTITEDKLTNNQIIQRQNQFDKTINTKISLEEVIKTDLFKAFTVMNLQPSAVKTLQADIQHGKTKLAWITVWDDIAEDGDIINIQAGGFNVQVSLLNEPQKMAVPINQGEINITGVADGGGGITLGFKTTTGYISMPVIAVGQTITIPVKK